MILKAYQVIREKVQEVGITKAELARRVGMDDELLRRSLLGNRKITADEFVKLCGILGLNLADFK